MMEKCPCQSGSLWQQCCGPFLTGESRPETAEALMRSRFAAFVQQDTAYLMKTWHANSRPPILRFDDDDPQWQSLDVLSVKAGQAEDNAGFVEFIAHGVQQGRPVQLHERSQFVRQHGEWVYLDGNLLATPRHAEEKIGRNAPCPCGSGRKYKRCCAEAR